MAANRSLVSCVKHALGLEDLAYLADIIDKLWVAMNRPTSGSGQIDMQLKVDPPRSWRHHQDAIRQEHSFLDSMSNENDGIALRQPELLQVHDHLLACQCVECSKGLIH